MRSGSCGKSRKVMAKPMRRVPCSQGRAGWWHVVVCNDVSRHRCSHSNLDAVAKWSVDGAGLLRAFQSSLSLRTVVCHHNTRTRVRLLGPCYKTG